MHGCMNMIYIILRQKLREFANLRENEMINDEQHASLMRYQSLKLLRMMQVKRLGKNQIDLLMHITLSKVQKFYEAGGDVQTAELHRNILDPFDKIKKTNP